jgi:hypothetical protein
MAKINKQAWDLLSPDEKTALSLQLGLSKSSWESGEIMQKSHYKYLEIKYRAEFFLKFFSDHLALYDQLIPDYIKGNEHVMKYLKLCVEKRYKPMDAIKELKVAKAVINEKLIAQMEIWERSESPYDTVIYNFVKEFDRWNNFRILPRDIQEPSAYKRRIKNSYKKQIKITCSINTFSLDKLFKLYGRPKEDEQSGFLTVLYGGLPQVWKVKLNSSSTKIFNSLGLYYFNEEPGAWDYIQAVHDYNTKGKKACTDGLDFWPKYRELIKKAANYLEVQKMTPNRKHLQVALSKIEYL